MPISDREGPPLYGHERRPESPKPIASKAWVAEVMRDRIFAECYAVREDGQREYAHNEANAFQNFDDTSALLGMSREQCLAVYLDKHIRGIYAWVNGHKSQRESVLGRIKDAIVYLCLLYCMVLASKEGER